MGEMADYYIESYQNATEDELWDNDQEGLSYTVVTSTCKYCYMSKLRWKKDTETYKWRLHDKEGKVHICMPYLMGER